MAESSAARWQSAAREALHDDAYEAIKEHKDSRREAQCTPAKFFVDDVFVDDYSGRPFQSKLETIRKHVNDMNERLRREKSLRIEQMKTESGRATNIRSAETRSPIPTTEPLIRKLK